MLGNFLGYRLEDRTKLVLKPGAKVPSNHPAFGGSGGGMMFGAGPLQQLWLELNPGDYASYTVRDTVADCAVSIEAAGEGVVKVSCGEQRCEITVNGQICEYAAITLPAAEESKVRIDGISGAVQIAGVKFA